MTKSLIFCFDGTSNDPSDARQDSHITGTIDDSSITNVLKLHLLFGGDIRDNARFEQQHSYYYAGIGTYGSKVRQIVNKMLSPDHLDVATILRTAVADLNASYQAGDHLYCFGFSRGAALARRFAAIAREKSGIDDLEFRFMGVFDTVASIGKPNLDEDDKPVSDVVFENRKVAASVREALHLVSLDERRKAFMPTLMNAEDRVTEVWLAGAHSDVGGGYRQDGLSDISLQHMLNEIERRDVGLRMLKDHEIDYGNLVPAGADYRIDFDDVAIQPNIHGINHQQSRPPLTAKATLAVRDVRVNVDDQPSPDHVPDVHHTVATRIHRDREYRPESLRGCRHRVFWPNGEAQEHTGMREHTWALPLHELQPDQAMTVTCFANQFRNHTGIAVKPGQGYLFEVDLSERWKDGEIECDAKGWTRANQQLGWREMFIWTQEDNRRKPDASWFALLGSVGETDENVFEVLEHTPATDRPLRPESMGELFLFVNDVENRYDNNSGVMQVTIRRVT